MLHPTTETYNKYIVCVRDFGEGSLISTNQLLNWVDTARHRLILRQHGDALSDSLYRAFGSKLQEISVHV